MTTDPPTDRVISRRPGWAEETVIALDSRTSTTFTHLWTAPTHPTVANGADGEAVDIELRQDDAVTVTASGVELTAGTPEVFLSGLDASLSVGEARRFSQGLAEACDRYEAAEDVTR